MSRAHATLALALCLLAAGAMRAQDDDILIGVVQRAPDEAQRLAAAVDAALGAPDAGAPAAPAEPDEALALPAQVCEGARAGWAAALGGGALAGAAAARAGLPLLLAGEVRRAAGARGAALELMPHEDVLAEAAASLCRDKGWRRAVLLHAAAARPAALLAALGAPAADGEPLELLARQLPPRGDPALLRNLLLVLKRAGRREFIVWCGAACAERVLRAAQRVGLLGARHAYVVPALALHTRPLRALSHGGANVTGLMLHAPGAPAVRAALAAWRAAYERRVGAALDTRATARVLRAPPPELLLAMDASGAAAAAWRALQLPPLGEGADGCAHGAGAFHADTLLNVLRSEQWEGAAGPLRWEADGARRAVRLHVVELARGGALLPVGAWTPRAGVAWSRPARAAPPPPRDSMTNRTFTVLIAKNSPYVMRRESEHRLAGNAQYEGFCIELIERLGALLGFNYTFKEQEDGVYGTWDEARQQATGMVRALMEDPEVDFAITDLTITAEREKAVDFTTPFMNLGISILFRKPRPPEPALFAFLLPFSRGVWLGLALAYLGTSLLLYAVGRLCAEEWQNPYPCVDEPRALHNQFTLANALWFNLGAVLLQGSEIAPVAYGTRAVASVWWLFALVITSSYTANLATLLAKKSPNDLIHNVRELADNELGIKYGVKATGSTKTFFEHATPQSEPYYKMYEHMREWEAEMPEDNDAGVQKVMREDFAFLAESTTIEYIVERNCEVTMVGELLDSKGYGIAMKKNSTYRQAMNLALLNLQEAGVLREMKHSWWKEKHGGGACKPVDDRENVKLSMRNFLGLFLVLVVGCTLGVLASCLELAWVAARRPRDPAAPFLRRFASELRFVLRFERSVKPLRGSLSEPATPSATPLASPPATPSATPTAAPPATPPAAPSATPARRRSSMHAASLRLARHARAARGSSTPPPA